MQPIFVLMKTFKLIIAVLFFSLGVNAQTAKEEILKDIHNSASNYLAYPGPKQTKLTPAPDGKKPFYISHYGRHGSRFLINKDDYDDPYKILAKADSLGKLTPLGQDVLRRVVMLREEANLRLGELTQLGAEQHRQIAKRMFERFPEVFEGKANIDAKSTVVIRCILSMENALFQLITMNPDLRIRHDASQYDMWYMNFQDKKLKEERKDSTLRNAYRTYIKNYECGYLLMPRLFNDTAYVRKHVKAQHLGEDLFHLASCIQNTEARKKITLYDIFSDEEIYNYWKIDNTWWYIYYGACSLNGGRQPYNQRNLLRQIIQEADSCIALPKSGATLRFGHETMVMPLTCLLGLNGFDLVTDNFDCLERKGWINYKVFPMGANIQFIFYRKNPEDKDVLVKVLLNENEATLPIKSSMAPYYKWEEVRDYYLKKLDAYQGN